MTTQNRRIQNIAVAGIVASFLLIAFAGALVWELGFADLLNIWHLTRAAGLVAYALLFGSAALGLLQSLGMLKGLTLPLANLDVHEHLSLWAIYATLFHAVILVWDRYVVFSLAEVLIPFVSDYQPLQVGLGTLALYIMLVTTVSTYLRAKMTPQRWRALHLASLAGFLFALIHGVAMGTDTGHPAVAYMYRFTGIAIGLLSTMRLYKGVRARHANPARRG